jgi:hypothetical protein
MILIKRFIIVFHSCAVGNLSNSFKSRYPSFLMSRKTGLLALAGIFFLTFLIWVTSDTQPPSSKLQAALKSYQRNQSQVLNTRYLTLIDYTKPVLVKRLWVVEIATGKIVLNSHVSHAFNSGLLYATNFSNVDDSKKSCVGNFVTQTTYTGRFGYSLRVRGLDADNSNTLQRNIVFHPHPVPVWSQGCWMTSPATNRELINLIKGKSFLLVAN